MPRKPHAKRVSFIREPQEDVGTSPMSSNDATPSARPVPHEVLDADPVHSATADTNDACEGLGSLLIRNRTPKTDFKVSTPVSKASLVHPEDLIIPPPPLFDNYVSDRTSVRFEFRVPSPPPITVIPERIVLPEPVVAETSMQSSNSTNSSESEVPPLVNYDAFPGVASSLIVDGESPRSALISEVPSYQVIRVTEHPSVNSDRFYRELSVSPGAEPDPPALLQARYKVLPTVSHVPNSPCSLHPDQTYFEDPINDAVNHSLRDLRCNDISPGMVHSNTYPPMNPYPSLTTVAGTYNPYTCTVPVCTSNISSYSSHKTQMSPTLVTSSLAKDINMNITRTISTSSDGSKSVQSERRVRFGDVTAAPEFDRLSNSSESLKEGSSSPTPTLKPAWSSKIKAFAIGEVIINVRNLILAHTLSLF